MNALFLGMNHAAATGLTELLNTLWYAAAVVGLTWLILRLLPRVNAATRYWIWTGVLGSLLAFPFLPGLVGHVRTMLAGREQAAAVAAQATVQAAPPSIRPIAPVMLRLNAAPGASPWPLWLLAAWTMAAAWQLTRLARGIVSVRRLKARARIAPSSTLLGVPVPRPFGGEGGERSEPGEGVGRPVRVLTSQEVASPIAVGFRHPAIVVPPDLLARLDDVEKRDVLLHEMAHLDRYDDWLNLATRALGALLVLHPLAAIVMKQIEREREMACDDSVVAHTGSARNYARSLARLHDLRWSKGARLLAPALLGGGCSLANRIESLLRRGREFSARPSLASLGVSALLLALLLGAGGLIPSWIAIAQTNARPPHGTTAAEPEAKFEVASVKIDKPDRYIRRLDDRAHDGTLYAAGVTPEWLISSAYDIDDWYIYGGPRWIWTERLEVDAKADSTVDEELKTLDFRHAMKVKDRMVQELLADRFRLKVHYETRKLPVYLLEVAKGGPKNLELAKNQASPPDRPNAGGVERVIPLGRNENGVSFKDFTVAWLAGQLSMWVGGREVIDKTGIRGKYNYTIRWSNDVGLGQASANMRSASTEGSAPGSAVELGTRFPDIFRALKTQLGLELKPAKGPVQVLVIDHVEQPTPN
jgi:uncharacterized protein (TIGR03435 family)